MSEDAGGARLRSSQFRREREAVWRELDALLTRAEKRGIATLQPDELMRLPALYRATVSSLSVARSISLDRNVLEYLENLARRGYFTVYAARLRLREAVARFFAQGFPEAVRIARWHVLAAAIFFALGTATGWLAVDHDGELFNSFVSEGLSGDRGPDASAQELRAHLYDTDASALDSLQLFASYLFTHNSQVGIMSFALSFALGIPTFLLLFYNGLVLGAFASIHGTRGLSLDFWGWVLPHGITEIGAIVLCGAAGLLIADALVFPGAQSRLDRLAQQGRIAGQIVLGAIAMLLIAALIEGFFRQLVHDIQIRYGVAALSAAFWAIYFWGAGRVAGGTGDE